MPHMESAIRSCAVALAIITFSSSWGWPQTPPPDKKRTTTESIGDAVRAEDKTAAPQTSRENAQAAAQSATKVPPVHVLYVHGINQIGAGDSLRLRKGICKYVGECTVTNLGRIYAEGPFVVNSPPPTLTLRGERIWHSKEDWSASAPFLDRYLIQGEGHTPILLDEFNWWPLAYPLKCKWLIARDARLTGPSKTHLEVCSAATTPDPAHPERYLSYQWISTSQAAELEHAKPRARILNRSLKSGLMDWGFGDAVMALGPLEEVLTAGIRELLIKSLQSDGADPHAVIGDEDADVFFVTHSLGSYLSLVALDADLLGPDDADLKEFQITPEQRQAAEYFSAHTAGFYMMANQIALLQLARVSGASENDTGPCPSGGKSVPSSIAHWRCKRDLYLKEHASVAREPQIVAWSDPNDLLSWEVPPIEGVHVVNISVRNPGFKIPPFLESPTSARANYAQNKEVLRRILKPSSQ